MDPIQPLGVDRFSFVERLRSTFDPSQVPAAGMSGAGQTDSIQSSNTISSLQVSSSVSQMLSAIGGGVQKNQMLEMMIALLIIMSMLEQQRSGGSSTNALEKLAGSGQNMMSSSVTYTSTHISTQVSSLSYSHLQISQSQGSGAAGTESQGRFDATA